MDQSYYLHLGDPQFYAPLPEPDDAFGVPMPPGWVSRASSDWLAFAPAGHEGPRQGWKIHVTATVDDAAACIKQVADVLFDKETPFKVCRTRQRYVRSNSKYGNRAGSGKLITVYPADDNQFVAYLDLLEASTRNFRPGPYILTDRRWRDSNVYYRYGAFVRQEFEHEGKTLLGIADESGQMVEDQRVPGYSVPDWVNVPAKVREEEQFRDQEEGSGRLINYGIESALHFSNGGGVYSGRDQRTDESVVLKEGRPRAGLDGTLVDAFDRIGHEARMFHRLGACAYVPRNIDDFVEWEHRFLVMSHVEGTHMGRYIAENYPFQRSLDPCDYVESITEIVADAVAGLTSIHSRGVALGDVQPTNIIIREDESETRVCFIDLEAAGNPSNPGSKALATPGYFARFDDPLGHRDWVGLLRVIRMALLPMATMEFMAPEKLPAMRAWIRANLGATADDCLQQVIDAALHEGYSITDLPETEPRAWNRDAQNADRQASLLDQLGGMVIDHCDPTTTRLAPGDVRQWTRAGGDLSVAYGGAGIAMALWRSGLSSRLPQQWAEHLAVEDLLDTAPGLLAGRAGIACVLAEVGDEERAKVVFDSLRHGDSQSLGIDLDSGLSGIGLGLLGASEHFSSEAYLEAACQTADLIMAKGTEEDALRLDETDVTPTGLFYGWAGPSLFLSCLSRKTGSTKHREAAESFLDKELDRLDAHHETRLIRAPDGRLMSYLSLGSAGLLLPMAALEPDAFDQRWADEVAGIMHASTTRPCANFGLFRGFVGLQWATNWLEATGATNSDENLTSILADELDLYLIDDKSGIATPGDFMLRRSCDLATGASGLICVLNDIGTRRLSWLPVLCGETLITAVPGHQPQRTE